MANEEMKQETIEESNQVVVLESSRKEFAQEQTERQVQIRKDLAGLQIQKHGEIIKVLAAQISNQEPELIEKDRKMTQLEKALEEAREELFSTVNLH